MAGAVPEEMSKARTIKGRLGAQILDVIAVGMYNDPRMALREYIQNAVDSLDLAEERCILAETGRTVWSASSTRGGVNTWIRLFGGGGKPMNEVTREAVEELLDNLFM